MRAVVDTNVLVSALISPGGPCDRLLAAAVAGVFTLVLDESIIAEYELVLHKSKFGFDPALVESFITRLEAGAEKVTAPPAGLSLPDETDAKFVEVALASAADCVVTGNTRHFPAKTCGKVRILTPAQFLARLAGEMHRP